MRICLFYTLLIATSLSAYTQSTHVGIVDTIIITGNTTTRDYVILDEMTLKTGSAATPELIAFDKNRIYNLGLFTRVDILTDTLEGRLLLNVDVNERWHLIPVPILGFRDGDPEKPFFGGGVLHNNFQGANQKLFAAAVFGYNPSLTLSFSDPLIHRKNNLYFSSQVSFSRIRNRSALESSVTGDFDERHYDVSATLGKRMNLFETLGIQIGYKIVSIDEFRPGRTVSTDGKDRFIHATLQYAYDTRDLKEYTSHGSLISFFITKHGFTENNVNYTRLGGDVRHFLPLIGDLSLGVRAHGSFASGGMVPAYARTFFGFGERIRGYYTTVLEGDNAIGTQIEARFPILTPRIIRFTAIPIPVEFAIWRIGISLAIFGDAGTTWFRGTPLSLQSLYTGYGAGIHLLLPYSAVVRVEYAMNKIRNGQFVFGFRTSF